MIHDELRKLVDRIKSSPNTYEVGDILFAINDMVKRFNGPEGDAVARVLQEHSDTVKPDPPATDDSHQLEQARRNWRAWQQRAEIAEERLAAMIPATDEDLLKDAMKLLDVAGMWKAPVDEQWRMSYADIRKRYDDRLLRPSPSSEQLREAIEKARNYLRYDPGHKWIYALEILDTALTRPPQEEKPEIRAWYQLTADERREWNNGVKDEHENHVYQTFTHAYKLITGKDMPSPDDLQTGKLLACKGCGREWYSPLTDISIHTDHDGRMCSGPIYEKE